MTAAIVRTAGWVTAIALATASASAQDRRLSGRLDSPTAVTVWRLADSADKVRLPGAAIIDRALELQARGAPGPVIVDVVRRYTAALGSARAALGDQSSVNELESGAAAVGSGVPPRDLVRFRSAAPRRSLTTALSTVSDLVAMGVPVGVASDLVVSMLRAGVRDSRLAVLQQDIRADVARGADAAVAASARVRGAIDEGG